MARGSVLRGLALAAALALLAGRATALYEKGGPVLTLTHRSFDAVTSSKVPVVVEFFAPWCGHCKSLAPAFSKAAAKLQGIVPFVAVDCDKEANRPLCGRYGVQGFPTIKLFTPSASGGSPAVADYNGERAAKPLADAATGLLTPKHVRRLKAAPEAAAFAAAPGTKVVLVTDKAETPAMLKSFGQRFAGAGLSFARVQAKSPADSAAAELLSHLGGPVDRLPTLLALSQDGTRTLYEGETKAPKILEWLKSLAAGKPAGGADAQAGAKPEAAAQKQADGGKAEDTAEAGAEAGGGGGGGEVPAELPQVVDSVDAQELTRRLEHDGLFVVGFFLGSDDGCREARTKLNSAVHGLQGLAKGLQLDLRETHEAAIVKDLFSLELPTPADGACESRVFLVPFDTEEHEDADDWRPWSGELTSRELHKAAVELFPAGGITRLTADTYQAFASASGLDRPKIILFSDKEEPPAVFRALSCNFKPYKFDFALVGSGDAKLMEQFNVQKVPHLVALFAHSEDGQPPQPGQKVQMALQPYLGPVRYGAIAGWLTLVGLQTRSAPPDALHQFGGQQRDAMVAQVTDQESWEASCLGKGGVCVVAALGGGEQQAGQLEVLRAAASGRGDQPVHFCWFEPGAGPEGRRFAAELGLGEGAAPALVAVAPKKERTAVMTARFDKDGIAEWLDGLLAGKVRTEPLQRLPAFPAPGGAAAEAAAAQEEAPAEEEFDLSDIMSEEIEGDLSKPGRHEEL